MDGARFEDIGEQLSFGIQRPDGHTDRKTIYALAEAEVARFHSLGTAFGEFPGVAIHEAFTHCPDFFDRVVAYRLADGRVAESLEEATGRSLVSIEFYEDSTC